VTPGERPLVAGNWKMNGTSADMAELHAVAAGFMGGLDAETEAALCLPATLISRAREVLASTPVKLGGQNCHPEPKGAHTGDISAEMLKDAGAALVIVGHSERRTDHGETNELVKRKSLAAHRAGLTAIVCIGETRAEREAGETLAVLSRQLHGSLSPTSRAADTVIAYEPVWAIGTGLTPTAADVEEAHRHIRAELEGIVGDEHGRMRILYGGSVKPSNVAELLRIANVDGALVGGASLKAADFLGIAEAYRQF
jgi:triosephosphate isomerase